MSSSQLFGSDEFSGPFRDQHPTFGTPVRTAMCANGTHDVLLCTHSCTPTTHIGRCGHELYTAHLSGNIACSARCLRPILPDTGDILPCALCQCEFNLGKEYPLSLQLADFFHFACLCIERCTSAEIEQAVTKKLQAHLATISQHEHLAPSIRVILERQNYGFDGDTGSTLWYGVVSDLRRIRTRQLRSAHENYAITGHGIGNPQSEANRNALHCLRILGATDDQDDNNPRGFLASDDASCQDFLDRIRPRATEAYRRQLQDPGMSLLTIQEIADQTWSPISQALRHLRVGRTSRPVPGTEDSILTEAIIQGTSEAGRDLREVIGGGEDEEGEYEMPEGYAERLEEAFDMFGR